MSKRNGLHIFGAKRDTEESARKAQGIVEAIAKNTAAAFCVETVGPMAKLFAEFMERQQALEDALWYCAECKSVTFGPDGENACHPLSPRAQYRYVAKDAEPRDVQPPAKTMDVTDGEDS